MVQKGPNLLRHKREGGVAKRWRYAPVIGEIEPVLDYLEEGFTPFHPASQDLVYGRLPRLMTENAPILVVEDDENDVELIRRTLSQSGIPNPRRFVKSGEQAISYLLGMEPYSDRKKHPLPGLVLLDLKLTGMDGFEVLEWIRNHRHFGELRVVVLTCSKDIRDVKKAYRLGANSFLVKPLEFENARALFATIGAQLWKRHTNALIPERPSRDPGERKSVL